MKVDRIGVAWFGREDYPNIIKLFIDGDRLPKTYDQWLEKATEITARLRSEGKFVVKAHIDSKTFPEWCRVRGLNINADARRLFAAEFATRDIN